MKKLLALLLALCLVASLCACKDRTPADVDIEDGPGGLWDVSDEPVVEEESPYPGKLPLGGETASGTIVEIPDEGSLEYIGSKVVFDDYSNPVLLSWFTFTKAGEYEGDLNSMTIYAYQSEEELWATSYSYNEVALDDSLYKEINPGETLEVCLIFELQNIAAPVTMTFNNLFEELEPIPLTLDLSEIEVCTEAVEGISGLYMAQYLYAQDVSYDYDALVEYGIADNSFVALYDDGTGVLCVGGQGANLLYDPDCFYIGEEVLYYSLADGILSVEGEDLYYEFLWTDPSSTESEQDDEPFIGETVTTPKGYVSIVLDEGWYIGDPRSNDALTLYREDLGPSRWFEILDLQLTDLEHELEYTHYAMASAEYEEVTFGSNTYQMLYSDTYGPQAYLVAETSTGKAFTIEIRSIPLDEVMAMLESIVIH